MNPQPKKKNNKKKKTGKDKKYREWLRTQPCCKCGNEPIEGVRDTVYAHQNLGSGHMAGKGHDRDAVPLCVTPCHAEEHRGHKTFWGGTDIKAIIKELNERYEK